MHWLFVIAIGFVIVTGACGTGAFPVGAFDPAMALGLDISSAGMGFGWGSACIGHELFGAAIAQASSTCPLAVSTDCQIMPIPGKCGAGGTFQAAEFARRI